MENLEEKVHELTESLETERRARQTAEAATEAAEQARQEFVSLVTHELRVPMTSIKGYTDLLLKGIMGPINDPQKNFLNVIRTNVERMSRMVADLSDINRLEGERLPLNLTAVSLADVVKEAVQAHAHAIEGKAQTVTTTLPDNLPPAYGDRTRLIQVLSNVVGNATQYTPESGVIEITAEALPQAEIHVMVQDNGIGILESEQSRVFEKFFRASDEETRQTPGNGLALHLSRQLMELHNGRIWFESKRGAGTTFHIVLPATPA